MAEHNLLGSRLVQRPCSRGEFIRDRLHILFFMCTAYIVEAFRALFRFYFTASCKSKADMRGKTVVITGGNTGIGKETAIELASRGARVIIACRDAVKAKGAAEQIKSSTNQDVRIVKLDLCSLASIKQCADEILAGEPRIDVLINNAGVMMCPEWKTKDGFELQFGVNHLGHFYFTNLLLDRIKESAPAKIVTLSSIAHKGGKIHFESINLEQGYQPLIAYCQSKLANILFSAELARRLEGTGVRTYCVHPGIVNTEINRHNFSTLPQFLAILAEKVASFAMLTPVQGAQTTLHCVLDEGAADQTGLYYSDCEPCVPSERARNRKDASRLWELSQQLIDEKIK